MKSWVSLLSACKLCPILQAEVSKKSARIALLEKESYVVKSAECALCQGFVFELEACRATKARSKEENTFHRTTLKWVLFGEP